MVTLLRASMFCSNDHISINSDDRIISTSVIYLEDLEAITTIVHSNDYVNTKLIEDLIANTSVICLERFEMVTMIFSFFYNFLWINYEFSS